MTPTGAQIFISYRRDDTAGYARALNDALAQQFGAEQVFIDVDDISAGQAFDTRIAQAIGQAQVLLVLIGPRWLAPQDDGLPRLHRPDDLVRREISTGLASGLRVIPVLLDGAPMPAEDQLPAALQALARRQALVVDPRRFAADTQQLLDLLRSTLGAPAPAHGAQHPPAPRAAALPAGVAAPGRTRRRPTAASVALAALAAMAALAALVAAGWWALRPTRPQQRPWPRARPSTAAGKPMSSTTGLAPGSPKSCSCRATARRCKAQPPFCGCHAGSKQARWPASTCTSSPAAAKFSAAARNGC